MNEYRKLELRYGAIIAEAVTEEIRKVEDGRVIYFAGNAGDIDQMSAVEFEMKKAA